DPANAGQPIARTGQRTDGIPAQWRLRSPPAPDHDATRLGNPLREDGDQVFAQPERVPQEVGAVATAVERFASAKQRTVRTCARASAPGAVQTRQPARWSSDD